MDHTEALPRDVLAGILGRLSPRDLAVSRCVHRAWHAVVDGHRLLRLRAEHLPHSVEGIFGNYNDQERPQFLGRPSTQHPGVDYGNLHFLPDYTDGYKKIADHCNGLLLYGDTRREFCVVNPATRRWERLPGMSDHGKSCTAYLAFDPTVSPQYEVFLIPDKDLGLFDLTDCEQAQVPPEQLIEENFTLSSRSSSKTPWTTEVPQHSVEWPPPLLTLEVFSSSTGQWQERSFVREGSATTRAVNVRGCLRIMLSGWLYGPRWRYSVYCHGALYVLLCRGAFVTRLSSSDGKYQVIKTPIDVKESKATQSYVGRLRKDVYYANVHDEIRIWTLNESSGGKVDYWVPKNTISLEPFANITSLIPEGICGPWILDDDHVLDEYGNNKMLAGKNFDWDSDDDDILDTASDECGHRRGREYIELLGFHPYKEIAFVLVNRFEAAAYHLDSSKVQYIGNLRPVCNNMWISLDEAFLYTPCMIGDLKENANTIDDESWYTSDEFSSDDESSSDGCPMQNQDPLMASQR